MPFFYLQPVGWDHDTPISTSAAEQAERVAALIYSALNSDVVLVNPYEENGRVVNHIDVKYLEEVKGDFWFAKFAIEMTTTDSRFDVKKRAVFEGILKQFNEVTASLLLEHLNEENSKKFLNIEIETHLNDMLPKIEAAEKSGDFAIVEIDFKPEDAYFVENKLGCRHVVYRYLLCDSFHTIDAAMMKLFGEKFRRDIAYSLYDHHEVFYDECEELIKLEEYVARLI